MGPASDAATNVLLTGPSSRNLRPGENWEISKMGLQCESSRRQIPLSSIYVNCSIIKFLIMYTN
jgi:hypothetical protein